MPLPKTKCIPARVLFDGFSAYTHDQLGYVKPAGPLFPRRAAGRGQLLQLSIVCPDMFSITQDGLSIYQADP